MTIYVGNINYSLSEDDIRKIFEVMGKVESVKIVQDKRSGRSKGYGFIRDMETQESVFVHANNLLEPIKENNLVSFEKGMGQKGPTAIQVKLIK